MLLRVLAGWRSMVLAIVLVAAFGCDGAWAQKPVEKPEEAPASAIGPNQIAFSVRSTYPNVVDVAFYADKRNAAWPGNGRVYMLRDSAVHRYVLNCVRGETICYGAGVRNVYKKYWGVGIGNKVRCSNCCYQCLGQETKVIVLNP